MRHTEKLHDIYVEVSKRLESEARAQGASESELAQYGNITSREIPLIFGEATVH